MAAQRRAIKLTPFAVFIDRETETRSLAALVAAIKQCCSLALLKNRIKRHEVKRTFRLDVRQNSGWHRRCPRVLLRPAGEELARSS